VNGPRRIHNRYLGRNANPIGKPRSICLFLDPSAERLKRFPGAQIHARDVSQDIACRNQPGTKFVSQIHHRGKTSDRELSDVLGHADPAFTKRVYVGSSDRPAEVGFLDEVLPVGGQGEGKARAMQKPQKTANGGTSADAPMQGNQPCSRKRRCATTTPASRCAPTSGRSTRGSGMQASWMSLHGKRLPVTGSADPFLQPLTIPLVEARQVDLPLVALDSAAGMGRAQLVRRARLLAWAGLGWHAVEAVIAVIAGLAAGSIALVGFGADSVVEGIAGVVVLWRFTEHRTQSEAAERRAQQLIGISFYAIAAYVAVEAIRTLAIADHPEASWVGIGLAAVTLSVMPALAAAKARVGDRLGSSATKSEGRQNLLCAYLSAGLLVGLAANAFLGWWWADPVTAFLIAAVAVNEGREAWRGEACCDAC
jgi:hypothetical protein